MTEAGSIYESVASAGSGDGSPTAFPRRARGFLLAIVALAALLSVAALTALDARSAPWLGFGVLAGVCALANWLGARAGWSRPHRAALPFLVAAALTLPPGLIVLVALAGHLSDRVGARHSRYIETLAAASSVLASLALWAVVHGAGAGRVGSSLGSTLAAAGGVLGFIACDRALRLAMLRLAGRRSVRSAHLWWGETAVDLGLGGAGLALVGLWDVDPLLALAVALPALLVPRSFAAAEASGERERERELRAAEMRYRLLVEQLPLATYILAPDHTVMYISPQIESILGCSVQEAIEEDEFWTERLHPGDRERIPAAWRECVARGHAFRAEYRMIGAGGRTVWIQDEAVAAREGDVTLYFQGYLLDITERKTAEERLARLSQQNELLLRSVGEGIFGLDLDGRVMFANPAAGRLTGCPPEQLLGLDLHAAIAHRESDGFPCTGARCLFTATIRDGVERHFEAEITRLRNGVTYAADCTTTPLVEGGQLVGTAVVIRDISEQRELEEQLRQAQKLEAVGKLAGGIAHDFNNLLTAIAGHSELALARLGDDPAGEHVSEIKRAADRASALTQQLLAFSRKQVLQPRVLNMNAVVLDVESLLRRLIGEDIRLEHRLDSRVAPVRADRGQLEQVLVNLAVNARDAMPSGGDLRIDTTNVDLAPESARALQLPPGGYVKLTVSDTGHGMSPEICARVFEPFFTTKEPGKGTGLGLATAYGIVAQSGGTMAVESSPGAGTVFTVYLPQAEEEARKLPPPAERSSRSPPASGTILLVEDEEMVRELTHEMLRRSGVAVLTASNPSEALALCREHGGPIDVLLTDVVMPGMSGHALAEQARAFRPELEIVYTSGYSDDVVAARGMLEPGTRFLAKPFTSEALIATINEALRRREEAPNR